MQEQDLFGPSARPKRGSFNWAVEQVEEALQSIDPELRETRADVLRQAAKKVGIKVEVRAAPKPREAK